MFSNKEATAIAVRALGEHVGHEAAEDFRRTFEPISSDLIPPARGSLGPISEINAYGARVSRLVHVDSPEVLGALGRAAAAGSEASYNLLVDIARNPYGESYGRLGALRTLARHFPEDAGQVAASLMDESPLNGSLGEALLPKTRTPETIPALERVATHRDYPVRESAMSALVELGVPGSEALARLLLNPDHEVRNTAANALMRQKLATPSVLLAIDELARRYPEQAVTVSQLRDFVAERGFSWRVPEVIAEARTRFDAIDAPPEAAPPPRGRLFGLLSAKRQAPDAPPGPEKGLFDWHREREGIPLTPPERVAESVVKLAMLRPQVLRELDRAMVDHLEPGSTIGSGRLDFTGLEMWRAEQRDSKVFGPLARLLERSEGFRHEVRRIVESVSS